MFKKIVDKLIEKEFDKRKIEILQKSKEFCQKINEEEQTIIEKSAKDVNSKIDLLNIKFIEKENELNLAWNKKFSDINKHNEEKEKEFYTELNKRFEEIKKNSNEKIKDLIEQENKRIENYADKKEKLFKQQEEELIEFRNKHSLLILGLEKSAENQIVKLEETRQKCEVSQKELWDKLDILKDNLNTEQIWMKLWECAFSKAVDVVWSILKNEAVVLSGYAKTDGYKEAEDRLSKLYENKLNDVIEKSNKDINVALILKRKEEADSKYLHFNKCKDSRMESYYLGQKELIEEVFNDKKD